MNSIPEGKMRDEALKRIEILDCGKSSDTMASCDPAAQPPSAALEWQKALEAASIDDATYAEFLSRELQTLVCVNDANAIQILRGIGRIIQIGTSLWGRLAATGPEAPALVDFFMSKDCPVSASLTDNDKAQLLKIKQEAEKEFAAPAASKSGK